MSVQIVKRVAKTSTFARSRLELLSTSVKSCQLVDKQAPQKTSNTCIVFMPPSQSSKLICNHGTLGAPKAFRRQHKRSTNCGENTIARTLQIGEANENPEAKVWLCYVLQFYYVNIVQTCMHPSKCACTCMHAHARAYSIYVQGRFTCLNCICACMHACIYTFHFWA